MAHAGAEALRERRRRAAAFLPHINNPPAAHEMVSTSVAAAIVGVNIKTIERWVDDGKINGGRPDVPGSRRWVDARHAVMYAISAGRDHLIPAEWRYLVSLGGDQITSAALPGPRAAPDRDSTQ